MIFSHIQFAGCLLQRVSGRDIDMTLEKKSFISSLICGAILGYLISMLVAKHYG